MTKPTMSGTLEENKALVRRWLAAVDRHESSAVDEFLAPDYIDHNPPPVPDLPPGRDGVRAYMSYFYAGTPDGRHVIDDQIAEGDMVVTVLRGHGTHTGEVIGIPATAKTVVMRGIAVHRVRDGKLCEHWGVSDFLSLFQQLGVIPANGLGAS